MQKNDQDRYLELVKLLNQYSYQYHALDNPSISDAVYDGLIAELKALEGQYPDEVVQDSPTQRVGSKPAKKFEKFTHTKRMISLLDSFSDEETRDWLERIKKLDSRVAETDFWVDSKKDGLACSLHYEDGQLVRAITRGDGSVGEVVTGNVRTIKTVPLSLEKNHEFSKGFTEVRGEIIMTKDDFAKLNMDRVQSGLEKFMNPRNLSAGTIRQLDPKLVSERPLRFFAYDLIRENESDVPTNEFAYNTLTKLGFFIDDIAHKEKNIDTVI